MFEGLKKKLKNFLAKEKKVIEEELKPVEETQPAKEETEEKTVIEEKAVIKEEQTIAKQERRKESKVEKPKKKQEAVKSEKEAGRKLVPKLTVSTKIKKAITGKARIKEEDIQGLLWDFQLELLESDVSPDVAGKICDNVKEQLVGREVSSKEDISNVVKKTLEEAVEKVVIEPDYSLIEKAKDKKPFVIMFLGPNGHGKTTTIGKIAHYFQENGLSSVIAAADTFRAAAIEQVEKVGKKAGVKVIKHSYGADPTAVAFDAVKHADSKGIDVVLIDTAGRSELNKNLMEQIKKMQRVIKPDMIIYIGEALAGNAAVEEAKKFNEFVPIDGVIMTKADADVKGGSILSISYELKKPILFIGTGQELKDLMPFKKEWFLKQLFE